ncbi:MAG: GMP synthase [Cyclobacteriaceae bacterium]|nr:GMP synthase [Cyclobacteriaceae bacterium]
MSSIKIAILDLYEGETNEGMRCILQLVEQFKHDFGLNLTYDVIDVRLKKEIADLSYDAYISSGGPGSPLESEGSDWERNFFGLMDGIRKHNSQNPFDRKSIFLICHSLQIYCRYYNYAQVKKRKGAAFGVMMINKTKSGRTEPLLKNLPDPFYGVDSRTYQIVQPREEKIISGGGQIVCIEKDRPHVELERAVMAIRFDEAIFGAQFHPEADSDGMYKYLITEEKKRDVIEKHGEKKYYQMLQYLNEPDKIKLTYKTIVPSFLRMALKKKMNAVLL